MSGGALPAGLGGVLVLPAADYRRDRSLWLRARRWGLGASDMAAVLGLNPYRTALDVWLDKTADTPATDGEESEPAAWGHLLEAPVARRTVRQRPELGKLVPTPGLLAHPEFPWMLATIDYALAARGSRSSPVSALLEVKTTSAANYRRNWIDGVPPAGVQVQCQQQMAVTGLDLAWVTCAVGGYGSGALTLADPYPVPRSERVIGQLIGYGGAWWAAHIVGKERPEPVFADAAKLSALYPADEAAGALELTDELEGHISALLDARRRAAIADADAAAAEFRIKTAMAGHTAIADRAGDVLVTWKEQTSRRLDQKALAAAHPDIVAAFKPAKVSRVLRVKNQEERI